MDDGPQLNRGSIVIGTPPTTMKAFVTDQAEFLAQQGWEVHLVTGPSPDLVPRDSILGIKVHVIHMARRPAPISDLKALIAWRRLLRELRPNVVVASTPKAALLGMLASRLVGTRRRVYLVRGLRLEGLHGLAATVGGLVEQVASWCATDLLFVSKSLQTAFLARHLSNPTKANVLGGGSSNGVNLRRFPPPSSAERQTARSSFGLADDDLVVGFVGRLTADKGIAHLVRHVGHCHRSPEGKVFAHRRSR